MPVHAVAALALPAVEAFDLAIPAQVFGDRRQAGLTPGPGRDAGTTPTAYRAAYQGRGPRPANRPPA